MRRFAFLAACAWAIACSSNQVVDTTPKIVTVAGLVDQTGASSKGNWPQVLKFAEQDANDGLAKQPYKNLRFSLPILDTPYSATPAATNAIKAVKEMGAKAIVSDSSPSHIAITALNFDPDPTRNLGGVPVVSASASSPFINNATATDANPLNQRALRNEGLWSFRTCMSSIAQAQALARIALADGNNGDVNGDGKFKLDVFVSNEPFAMGFAQALKDAVMLARPGAIVEIVSYAYPVADPTTFDWATGMGKANDNFNEDTKQQDGFPDALVEQNFPQLVPYVVKAYAQGGFTTRFLHGHGFIGPQILSLGSIVEGHEGASYALLYDNADPFSQRIADAKTGKPVMLFDAMFYDAAMSIFLATVVAARDVSDPTTLTGAQIRDALRTINDPNGQAIHEGADEFAKAVSLIAANKPINYFGISGPVDFDQMGNSTNRLTQFKVVNGQYNYTKTFDCVADSSCPELP